MTSRLGLNVVDRSAVGRTPDLPDQKTCQSRGQKESEDARRDERLISLVRTSHTHAIVRTTVLKSLTIHFDFYRAT